MMFKATALALFALPLAAAKMRGVVESPAEEAFPARRLKGDDMGMGGGSGGCPDPDVSEERPVSKTSTSSDLPFALTDDILVIAHPLPLPFPTRK
jgi:hypothetical protein